MAEGTKARLTYFRGRGLGEQIRFMLAATIGTDNFENVYLEGPGDMEKLKEEGKLMFGQVPLLEFDDGTRVVQSMACVRHLARTHGLYGANDQEALLCDQIADGIRDFLGAHVRIPFAPDQEAHKRALVDTFYPKYLPRLEALLVANGKTITPEGGGEPVPVLVGSGLTFPDVTLTSVLRWVEEVQPGTLAGGPERAGFPLLKAHHEFMTEKWAPLVQFLASDKCHAFPDGPYRAHVDLVLGRLAPIGHS